MWATAGGDSSRPAVTSGARHYSYGSHLLCVSDKHKGTRITLERITYKASVRPLDVEFWLRDVRVDNEIWSGEKDGGPHAPYIHTQGRPTNYEGSDIRYLGAHTRRIMGAEITQRCTMGPQTSRFTDLVVVMKVDKRGGHISDITIEYRAGGKEYAFVADHLNAVIACGPAVPRDKEDDYCRDEA